MPCGGVGGKTQGGGGEGLGASQGPAPPRQSPASSPKPSSQPESPAPEACLLREVLRPGRLRKQQAPKGKVQGLGSWV